MLWPTTTAPSISSRSHTHAMSSACDRHRIVIFRGITSAVTAEIDAENTVIHLEVFDLGGKERTVARPSVYEHHRRATRSGLLVRQLQTGPVHGGHLCPPRTAWSLGPLRVALRVAIPVEYRLCRLECRHRGQAALGCFGGEGRVVTHCARARIHDTPTGEAKCLYAPSQTYADRPDDEAAQRSDHEQKTEGVTEEPGYADHYPGDQDEQAVEQLSGGHLSSLRLPGSGLARQVLTRLTMKGPRELTATRIASAQRKPICSATTTNEAISAPMKTRMPSRTRRNQSNPGSGKSDKTRRDGLLQ